MSSLQGRSGDVLDAASGALAVRTQDVRAAAGGIDGERSGERSARGWTRSDLGDGGFRSTGRFVSTRSSQDPWNSGWCNCVD
jgi:hypothetical protein